MQTKTYFIARYAETDQMGIVHHSNYPIWFEAGRTDFLKNAGVSNTSIEKKGIILPLYGMNCHFKSPARYEDEIVVVTELKKFSRTKVCFAYEVLNAATNKLLASGETMHAWTDKALKPVNAEKKIPELYVALSKLIEE